MIDSAVIMLIIAFTSAFGVVMIRGQVPSALTEFLLQLTQDPTVLLLLFMLFFLVVGLFMAETPAHPNPDADTATHRGAVRNQPGSFRHHHDSHVDYGTAYSAGWDGAVCVGKGNGATVREADDCLPTIRAVDACGRCHPHPFPGLGSVPAEYDGTRWVVTAFLQATNRRIDEGLPIRFRNARNAS